MKDAMPTTPSFPASASSAEDPSRVTESSETTQSVGK